MADSRPEFRVPISTDAIAATGFRTTLRGFDPVQVREYLKSLADTVRGLQEHNEDLQLRLREAEGRAANPVIGEAQLAAALGDETARILKSAHEAAAEIRGRAEEHVERVVQQARDDSSKLTNEAANVLEVRRAAAEAEASEILRSANEEAERVLSEANATASALKDEATKLATDTIEGAKTERNEVLSDVRRRRRVANTQIEQLRAGRERLLQAYEVVRTTLEQVTRELDISDVEARAAAEEVGRRMNAALDPNRADSLGVASLIDLPAPKPAPAPKASTPVVETAKPVVDSPKHEKPKAEPPAQPAPPPAAATDGEVVSRPHRKKGKGARPPAPAASMPMPVPKTPPPRPPVQTPSLERKVVDHPLPAPLPKVDPKPKKAEQADTPREVEEPVVAEPVVAEPAAAEAPSVATERIAARKDACAALEEQLTRRLKRALQDEQNLVLDRLRSVRGMLNADSALGAEAQHLANYAAIVEPALADAARAGASVVGEAVDVPAAAIATVANDLAIELILPLRRRLDERLHEAAAVGDDQFTASDRVSSAYRETKTQRAARLAEDWLVAAWAVGVHAATPSGTAGAWASDPGHPCCTDCDDNGLAGGVAKGTAFPTGHLHPPAHPGCRCVVVPTA